MTGSTAPSPRPQAAIVILGPGPREIIAPYRSIYCRSYSRCLDVALASGWPGFACDQCPGDAPLTPEELRGDLPGQTDLLRELLYPRRGVNDDIDDDEIEGEDQQPLDDPREEE